MSNRARILVVENESLIAKDVKMSLERLGYEVCGVVATYGEALMKAHEARPDLALMDINIDGNKDGIATAKALKTHYDIPVIFLTSLKEFDTVQKAKESDPFGYLVKPFRADDLQSSIEIALYNHSRTRNLQGSLDQLTGAMQVLETAVIILDQDGVIDYFNSRIEELSGYKKTDKKGASINQLLEIEGMPAWLYVESFSEQERLQNTFEFKQNSFLLTKTHQKEPVDGYVSSFQNAEGIIAGYLIVIADGKDTAKTQVAGDAEAELSGKIDNRIVDNYFFLKDKSSLFRIHIDSITYVEALGNYVKVHTPGKTYTALIPLKEIEKMLPSAKFFRVHRSFIVAVDKIMAIHHTELQVPDATIPIGKTFREDLLKRIQVI
jgi:PAS domain S-box-containing protein